MAGSVIQGENYRISVLTESLVRLEYSEDGVFEDGQTQVVQNRDFGPVACEVVELSLIHISYLTWSRYRPRPFNQARRP